MVTHRRLYRADHQHIIDSYDEVKIEKALHELEQYVKPHIEED